MDQQYQHYLATEWGKPTHGDQALFELLSLEIFQAGLNWQLVLHKRAALRQAFANFDIFTVAHFTPRQINQLLSNPALIRNRRKIQAIVHNAQVILHLQQSQSFDNYIWHFVNYQPQTHYYHYRNQIPTQTPLSRTMTQDLKAQGFQFVGPVIIYSFLQAAGLIRDQLL